jgi:hypothetical protein
MKTAEVHANIRQPQKEPTKKGLDNNQPRHQNGNTSSK